MGFYKGKKFASTEYDDIYEGLRELMEERNKDMQLKRKWDDVRRKWAKAGMYVLFVLVSFSNIWPNIIVWKEQNVSRKAKETRGSFPLQVIGGYAYSTFAFTCSLMIANFCFMTILTIIMTIMTITPIPRFIMITMFYCKRSKLIIWHSVRHFL